MKQWRVNAWIRVANPGVTVWNGSSHQTDTRQQQINTVVMANSYYEPKSMVEGQYGSSLIGTPVITEG